MNQTLKLGVALAIGLSSFSATAAEHYFLRVPAPARCAGGTCVLTPKLPGEAAPTPPAPPKPVQSGVLVAQTTTDYGKVSIGDGSTLRFTFTNTGTDSISELYASASGAMTYTGLPKLGNTCGSATRKVVLAAGASCSFGVAYAPTSAGVHYGTAAVSSTEAGQLAQLNLSGATGTPIAELSAGVTDGLDFGTVQSYGEGAGSSVSRTFTVTNRGDSRLTWPGANFDNPGAYWSAGQAMIAPGETGTITVIVYVSSPGNYTQLYQVRAPYINVDIPLTVEVK